MPVLRLRSPHRSRRLAAAVVASSLLGMPGCEPGESGTVSAQSGPGDAVKKRFNPDPTAPSRGPRRSPAAR